MTTYPQGLTLQRETLPGVAGAVTPPPPAASSKPRLLKEHACTVALPDGTEGACRYERLGPACHRFDYRYGDGSFLSRQYVTKPLGNAAIADVEAKARELAAAAFDEAMEHERKDYFARVTEPTDGSRKKNPSLYCLDAEKAKEHGGKYALCMPLGNGRLLRVSSVVTTFSEIAVKWRNRTNAAFVVGCCNRLDRRWEMPRLNPLHTEGHPQIARADAAVEASKDER